MPFAALKRNFVDSVSNKLQSMIFFGELPADRFHISDNLANILDISKGTECNLFEVLCNRLVSTCERKALQTNIDEFLNGRNELVQYGRIRLGSLLVWFRLYAQVRLRTQNGGVLVSGEIELLSFQAILSELLKQSAFSAEEARTLSDFAAEPAGLALGFVRLESDKIQSRDLRLLSFQVAERLRREVNLIERAEVFDNVTILFTAKDSSIEAKHFTEALCANLLRENYVNSEIKPVIMISGLSTDLVDSMQLRAGFWKELSRLFTNTLGPDKFSFREIVVTAMACINDFEGFKFLIQPLYLQKTLQPYGGEFLLRFRADQGFGPDRFVLMLERSSLAIPLSRWGFDHALSLASSVMDRLPEDFCFNINFSPRQTDDPELFAFFKTCVLEHGIDPRRVVIELTETDARGNQTVLISLINSCRHFGMRIAIDDFGSCYNSLSFLLCLPCDMVKLSREITMSVPNGDRNLKFLKQLVKAFHELGLTVSLEGVKDVDMYRQLKEVGADLLQGYHFCIPIEIKQLPHFLSGISSEQDNSRREKA